MPPPVSPPEPTDFLASVSDKIDGFLYRCLNNADYTMVRLTSGFDRMFGRSSADMVLSRQSFAELIYEEDVDVVRNAVDRALAQGRRWRIAYRFRHANDRWVWVYETGGGVRDPVSGEVKFLDGVVQDVSQFEACLAAKGRNLAAEFYEA